MYTDTQITQVPYRSCKSKIWLCSCFINSVYVWVPMRITHSIKYQVSRRDYVLTVQPQVCWWMLLNTGKVISTRMSTFLTQQNSTISTTIQWLIYINTTDKLPFTVVFTYVPCALIIIIIIIIYNIIINIIILRIKFWRKKLRVNPGCVSNMKNYWQLNLGMPHFGEERIFNETR